MDVSIILITYNSQDTISECLNHINLSISDSKLNCELIIVDALSKDNTLALIKSNSLYKKLISTDKLNRSSSFNMGVDQANGKYICRVDSRSLIPKNYIKDCFYFLEENKEYFNVGGKMFPKNPNKFIEVLYTNIISFGNADFRISKIDKDVDSVYLGFFNKKIFLDLGGYDEKIGFINEETDLNYIAIKKGFLIRLLSNLNVVYLTRNKIIDYHLTMQRYGAARCGFFLKHKKLSNRIILFIIFYLSSFINICLFFYYIKNTYLSLFILQFFILFVFFFKYSKKSRLNNFKRCIVFFQIVTGHIYWLKGFLGRLLYKNKKYN